MPDSKTSDDYDINVFINRPFDDTYIPLFRVLIFTIFACGYGPRCALEANDASRTRIEKILDIIQACRRGIHDIARISDIAGQDITAHDNKPELAIAAVRDWLATGTPPGIPHLPGGVAIRGDYQRFAAELPMICGEARLRVDELTFADYADFASTWLTEDQKTRSGTTDQTKIK